MFNTSNHLFESNINRVGDARDDLDTVYPFFIEKGKGAYVWDLDGNQYIDFTNANGGIVLGYCHDEVDQAVADQIINKGNIFATQYSRTKAELAKELLEIFEKAERVIFFKTGSDATDAAIRLARVASGKRIILTCGYHGWHDWQLNMFPRFDLGDDKHINFQYDLESLKQYIHDFRDDIAGVIVTPEYNYYDDDFYLQVQSIVKEANLIFVLDEVASGFRYCLGGLQKKIGLEPDMTCLGKGLANGYSISAVVGKNAVMKETCLQTHMWSTYNSELTGLVASLMTLKIMRKKNVPAIIQTNSEYFVKKLSELFLEYGVKGEMLTHPNIFHIVFEDNILMDQFVTECYLHGVLLSRDYENMLSLSHNKQIIDNAVERIRQAFSTMRSAGLFKDTFQNKYLISREALAERMKEEFDGSFEYSIFKDRK